MHQQHKGEELERVECVGIDTGAALKWRCLCCWFAMSKQRDWQGRSGNTEGAMGLTVPPDMAVHLGKCAQCCNFPSLQHHLS